MSTLKLPDRVVTIIRIAAFALGIAALLLSAFGERYGVIRYAPGGFSYSNNVSPIFVAVFVLALLLALRRYILGSFVALLAAGGLMAFAGQQLRMGSAVVVVLAFAIPGLLWLVLGAQEYSNRRAAFTALGAIAIGIAGFGLGGAVYARVWGPTHPESEVVDPPTSPLLWVWSGEVGATTASVRAKAADEFAEARLIIGTDELFAEALVVEPADRSGDVVGFRVEGLDAGTQYFYAVELDGVRDRVRTGRFQTFPMGASSFRVAFGGCARVGSNGRVFDAIDALDPLVYAVVGDFHYGDIDVDDVDAYREVLDLTLTQPAQANLYRSHPIAYVWDDHDFGANDSTGSSTSRAAAMTSYREYVPSYELAGPLSPIHQAWTIGRVRFVMTDARSARDEQSKPDDGDKTMLGAEQKAWLFDELASSSRSHELVVWINPVPWVTRQSPGADNWAGYSTERREIASFIAGQGIENLLMVSGDAHMVAIDDGSNTNYSDTPGPGFPLLHAAPLDRPGSIKGGPYSEGAIDDSGQFGVLDIDDDGERLTVSLRALDWQGAELISYSFEVPDTAR